MRRRKFTPDPMVAHFKSMTQRGLDESHLYTKANNDCQAIGRGSNGSAKVESIEGYWSPQEVQYALDR